MLNAFTESLRRIPGLGLSELHEAQRSAKLLRRRIETGRRPSDEDWCELFPDGDIRRLAQNHLDEGPGTPVFDPEATLTGDEQDEAARALESAAPEVDPDEWYELLSDLPDEGLPSAGRPGERIDAWALGRMIMGVSRGMQTVDYEELPVDQGFRRRFVVLAQRTGRLECITGLPRSA